MRLEGFVVDLRFAHHSRLNSLVEISNFTLSPGCTKAGISRSYHLVKAVIIVV
jgi:hypothetical protein